MPVTGTANLDRNRSYIAAPGTGPNSETDVLIPTFVQVDSNGDPVSAGGGDASAANQVISNAALGAPADAAWASGSGTIISILKGIFGKFVVGAGTATAATRVTLASNDPLLEVLSDAYETVAASQTAQILGATGAVGDFLAGVLIIPGTTAAGAVSIVDGNGSSISIFAGGGTTALTTLIPFFVPIGAKCVNATTPGWKVTTGANVTAIGVGNFT